MLYLRLLFVLTIIGFIDCVKVKFGNEVDNGHWGSLHKISFSFTVGGEHYFFGLTDISDGRYWFIQKLREDGKAGEETSTGTWDNQYTRIFPFATNSGQFICCISNGYYSIHEILPGGVMGKETERGYWASTPSIIFPYSIGGKQYVYSLTDKNWFIQEVSANGNLGSKIDAGSWNNYYTLGFPFSINGRQYFYCLSEKYWFIQELLPYGKMGIETDNGHWVTNHTVYVPFVMGGKYYFYGMNDDNHYWFIQELLPGGKMGTEKLNGRWQFDYPVSFSFNIKGRQFLYGLSEYYWFIQEIIQEPRLPSSGTKAEYCSKVKYFRIKRQPNSGLNVGWRGLNAVEELSTDIENDYLNYNTQHFSGAHPVTSVSTFRVLADANHATSIELTAAMRAEIHYRHMGSRRDDIAPEVYEHLRQMDRESDDEAGHLLASSLGGFGVPYNFVPQSRMLNRAVEVAGSVLPQPDWFGVEELLRDYLIENGGFVRWNLVPQYSLLPNSRRPTNLLLSIRFYNDHGNMVDYRGDGAIRSYNFLNVPTRSCTNLNDPWWNFL